MHLVHKNIIEMTEFQENWVDVALSLKFCCYALAK